MRNPETGQVESLKKKPKDEVDEMLKEEGKSYVLKLIYLVKAAQSVKDT